MVGRFRSFSAIEPSLAAAERSIALLARCQPINAKAEHARLLSVFGAGRTDWPRFRYDSVPSFQSLRERLLAAIHALDRNDPIGELYLLRIEELLLEIAIVEAIGTQRLRETALARFQIPDRKARNAAEELAAEWTKLTPGEVSERIVSDDRNDRRSLLNRMRRAVGEQRLPTRVEVCGNLSAHAATGDGVILIAPGHPLSLEQTERIVVHEVFGHAAPRVAATHQPLGLFALGSAWGNDEQEGFALHIEEQAGLLDDERKRELGLRHLAARSVQEGADWCETLRSLLALDAPLEPAIAITSRVHRGGGLAREVSYLPAFCRVRTAHWDQPERFAWLALGRLSLEAIDTLQGALPPVAFGDHVRLPREPRPNR